MVRSGVRAVFRVAGLDLRVVSPCVLCCRGYTRERDAIAGWLGVVGTGQDGPSSCGKSRLAVLLRP